MPKRLGPILFLPGSAVWQSAHFLNTFFPASVSPPASTGIVATRQVTNAPATAREYENAHRKPRTKPSASAISTAIREAGGTQDIRGTAITDGRIRQSRRRHSC